MGEAYLPPKEENSSRHGQRGESFTKPAFRRKARRYQNVTCTLIAGELGGWGGGGGGCAAKKFRGGGSGLSKRGLGERK